MILKISKVCSNLFRLFRFNSIDRIFFYFLVNVKRICLNEHLNWNLYRSNQKFHKMCRFSLERPLPDEWTYKSADIHLYRIGLCLTNDKSINSSRKWYNHPIAMFSVLALYLVMRTITLLVDKGTGDWVFAVLGDYAHFIGIRVYIDVLLIEITLFAIFSQIIYWLNFRKVRNRRF